MEPHLLTRPPKTPFSAELQEQLRLKAIERFNELFSPFTQIFKAILIGSSVKGTFGKYAAPGFRGDLYSDFDFILFVDDDYVVPEFLEREIDGKPFPDQSLNLAYKMEEFLDGKYRAEIFFIRRTAALEVKIQEIGEAAGIPMSGDSEHRHLVVYERQQHSKRKV